MSAEVAESRDVYWGTGRVRLRRATVDLNVNSCAICHLRWGSSEEWVTFMVRFRGIGVPQQVTQVAHLRYFPELDLKMTRESAIQIDAEPTGSQSAVGSSAGAIQTPYSWRICLAGAAASSRASPIRHKRSRQCQNNVVDERGSLLGGSFAGPGPRTGACTA
jgi:hypothetical protein